MRRLGKYLLIEPVASGGMAEVWRAEVAGPAGFVKQVAVKLVRADRGDDESLVRMFIQEAQLASCLSHANIVPVFGLDLIEGRYVIAMELVHSRSLREVLGQCRTDNIRFGLPRAVRVAQQVALALAYAHRPIADGGVAGLVHRDVSPSNILISFEGEVKLTDFGIARVPGAGSLTGPGMLKGKIGYMAPEQASEKPTDARADVFSLGVVLWEMCTGQALFARENEVATIRALTGNDPIPSPFFWNDKVPPELDTLVMGMLERDPERRTPSAEEVARRLAEVELTLSQAPEDRDLRPLMRRLWPGEVPSRPTSTTPVPAVNEPGSAVAPADRPTETWPGRGSRSRTPLALAAGLAVAIVAGGGWWLAGRRGEPVPSAAASPQVSVEPPAAATVSPPVVPPVVPPVEPAASLQDTAPPAADASAPPASPAPRRVAAPATRETPQPTRRAPVPEPGSGVRASADALEGLPLPPASSGEGILFVNALPWAEIELDGRVEGYTPREMRVAAGRHRLRLVHPSRGEVSRDADVKAGERLRVEVPLGR